VAPWSPPKREPLVVRVEPAELFTSEQIGCVSALVTPLGGAWMLRANFAKLGYPRAGWMWFAAIAAATGVFCWLVYFAAALASLNLGLIVAGYWIAMSSLTRALLGPSIERHREGGGEIASLRWVATITVAWGAPMLLWTLWFMSAFPLIIGGT
jgi:hypothetical protein